VLVALVMAGCATSSDVEVGAPGSTGEGGSTTAPRDGTTTTEPNSSSSGATPPTTLGSGPTTVGNVALQTLTASGKGSGYRIGVPESWTAIDPAAGSPDEVAAKIAELFPNGANASSLATAIRQGLVLFAIDPVSGSNVNVLVQDETVSLDLLAGQIDAQLASVGAAPAAITHPTLAGRKALRADTTLKSPPASVTQFYVVTDTQTYITTVTRPTGHDDVPVDAMAASLTIT
jgi:hypothetical protein